MSFRKLCFLILFTQCRRNCKAEVLKFEDGLLGRDFGVSPKECRDRCDRRPSCHTTRYNRKVLQCDFFQQVNDNLQARSTSNGKAIYVKQIQKGAEHLEKCTSTCRDHQECIFDSETASKLSCQAWTCGVPHIANSKFKGNMMKIGSKIMYTCVYNETETGTITCLDNGAWFPNNVTCPSKTNRICHHLQSNNWTITDCYLPRLNELDTNDTNEMVCDMTPDAQLALQEWEQHGLVGSSRDSDIKESNLSICKWLHQDIRSARITKVNISSAVKAEVSYICEANHIVDKRCFQQDGHVKDAVFGRRRFRCVKRLSESSWENIFSQTSMSDNSMNAHWTGYSDASGKLCNVRSKDIIDNWERSNIEKVKIEAFVNSTVVAYIVFNGKNTSMHTWFAKENLINSSWSDLMSENKFGRFSLNPKKMMRGGYFKFSILKTISNTTCSEDFGWFVTSINVYPCGRKGFPENKTINILFAKGNTGTSFEKEHVGLADHFDISVQVTK